MFQGLGSQTDALNRSFGFAAGEINVLLLSHAHIDHCGLLPELVKEGFKGKIYCTAPTRELAAILLEDSANIQKNESSESNNDRNIAIPAKDDLYEIGNAAVATISAEKAPIIAECGAA